MESEKKIQLLQSALKRYNLHILDDAEGEFVLDLYVTVAHDLCSL